MNETYAAGTQTLLPIDNNHINEAALTPRQKADQYLEGFTIVEDCLRKLNIAIKMLDNMPYQLAKSHGLLPTEPLYSQLINPDCLSDNTALLRDSKTYTCISGLRNKFLESDTLEEKDKLTDYIAILAYSHLLVAGTIIDQEVKTNIFEKLKLGASIAACYFIKCLTYDQNEARFSLTQSSPLNIEMKAYTTMWGEVSSLINSGLIQKNEILCCQFEQIHKLINDVENSFSIYSWNFNYTLDSISSLTEEFIPFIKLKKTLSDTSEGLMHFNLKARATLEHYKSKKEAPNELQIFLTDPALNSIPTHVIAGTTFPQHTLLYPSLQTQLDQNIKRIEHADPTKIANLTYTKINALIDERITLNSNFLSFLKDLHPNKKHNKGGKNPYIDIIRTIDKLIEVYKIAKEKSNILRSQTIEIRRKNNIDSLYILLTTHLKCIELEKIKEGFYIQPIVDFISSSTSLEAKIFSDSIAVKFVAADNLSESAMIYIIERNDEWYKKRCFLTSQINTLSKDYFIKNEVTIRHSINEPANICNAFNETLNTRMENTNATLSANKTGNLYRNIYLTLLSPFESLVPIIKEYSDDIQLKLDALEQIIQDGQEPTKKSSRKRTHKKKNNIQKGAVQDDDASTDKTTTTLNSALLVQPSSELASVITDTTSDTTVHESYSLATENDDCHISSYNSRIGSFDSTTELELLAPNVSSRTTNLPLKATENNDLPTSTTAVQDDDASTDKATTTMLNSALLVQPSSELTSVITDTTSDTTVHESYSLATENDDCHISSYNSRIGSFDSTTEFELLATNLSSHTPPLPSKITENNDLPIATTIEHNPQTAPIITKKKFKEKTEKRAAQLREKAEQAERERKQKEEQAELLRKEANICAASELNAIINGVYKVVNKNAHVKSNEARAQRQREQQAEREKKEVSMLIANANLLPTSKDARKPPKEKTAAQKEKRADQLRKKEITPLMNQMLGIVEERMHVHDEVSKTADQLRKKEITPLMTQMLGIVEERMLAHDEVSKTLDSIVTDIEKNSKKEAIENTILNAILRDEMNQISQSALTEQHAKQQQISKTEKQRHMRAQCALAYMKVLYDSNPRPHYGPDMMDMWVHIELARNHTLMNATSAFTQQLYSLNDQELLSYYELFCQQEKPSLLLTKALSPEAAPWTPQAQPQMYPAAYHSPEQQSLFHSPLKAQDLVLAWGPCQLSCPSSVHTIHIPYVAQLAQA